MALSPIEQLNRWFNPWRRRILMLVGKAIISAAKDAGKLQVVQIKVMKDEVLDVERVQEFGFTSVPPAGSEAVLLCIGGDRANAVVIASDSAEHRPSGLAEGDSQVYNRAGLKVWLKGDLMRLKTGTYDTHLDKFIDLFLAHTHLGNNGVVTSNPQASPAPTLPADFKKGDL